ncbi:MAG: ferritin family protein [Sedimentisphaerales bacterium]|nr:ferritin family protein [Sedimentisphaerales bacterium]
MDIFEYALKMEKDGESFYRELAAKVNNKGLQLILTMLADEEARHYQAIESMRQDKYQMAETTILDDAKNIFVEMKEKKQELEPDQEQIKLYEKAQEIEKKSQQFYNEKAQQADLVEHKKLFIELAKEEEKHYFLLENIIKFVSRPKLWLENAEWYHLEEY